jgi:hypothetical protein
MNITDPGLELHGTSAAPAIVTSQPGGLRIPTIYDVYTAGMKFNIIGSSSEGGATMLTLLNITLLLPNETFAGILSPQSNLRNFLLTTEGARFCVGNRCGRPCSRAVCTPAYLREGDMYASRVASKPSAPASLHRSATRLGCCSMVDPPDCCCRWVAVRSQLGCPCMALVLNPPW